MAGSKPTLKARRRCPFGLRRRHAPERTSRRSGLAFVVSQCRAGHAWVDPRRGACTPLDEGALRLCVAAAPWRRRGRGGAHGSGCPCGVCGARRGGGFATAQSTNTCRRRLGCLNSHGRTHRVDSRWQAAIGCRCNERLFFFKYLGARRRRTRI